MKISHSWQRAVTWCWLTRSGCVRTWRPVKSGLTTDDPLQQRDATGQTQDDYREIQHCPPPGRPNIRHCHRVLAASGAYGRYRAVTVRRWGPGRGTFARQQPQTHMLVPETPAPPFSSSKTPDRLLPARGDGTSREITPAYRRPLLPYRPHHSGRWLSGGLEQRRPPGSPRRASQAPSAGHSLSG